MARRKMKDSDDNAETTGTVAETTETVTTGFRVESDRRNTYIYQNGEHVDTLPHPHNQKRNVWSNETEGTSNGDSEA